MYKAAFRTSCRIICADTTTALVSARASDDLLPLVNCTFWIFSSPQEEEEDVGSNLVPSPSRTITTYVRIDRRHVDRFIQPVCPPRALCLFLFAFARSAFHIFCWEQTTAVNRSIRCYFHEQQQTAASTREVTSVRPRKPPDRRWWLAAAAAGAWRLAASPSETRSQDAEGVAFRPQEKSGE